ncbi:tRNA-(ms[2]io[6]A)-hydroxylase [Saccharophagus sp. K07]|jgi:tRNA-(ms[2]io[6]A)-hydroxylase|uniref:tRNA-(ms[2]io[6]A)-hydroxylase n=1 Tax=Saccharophagus sp. K07 TaxID=2283636 RepID=UPI001651BE67|nr:tRNA isopentenyl-2-thiomethyl-A-37 hydroxylase MiaE [Saccharophagus sp. K07]MBC6906887.1 tRNA-(ms[2]io[6]A)-hydroxylase [Saccharophagus sp. K07]
MLQPIQEFLLCPTPDAWVQQALAHPEILLIDHANCEKKAASTALNLMYRYIGDFELLNKMSRLAREELRHFEQVLAIMERRNIDYRHVSASRYAAELRKHVRSADPEKLIDTLIVGAIIEARSCERFARLAPHLDEELQKFYESLLKSEARHFQDYLSLAKKAAGGQSIDERVRFFLELEQELVESSDEEFRFHSGVMN